MTTHPLTPPTAGAPRRRAAAWLLCLAGTLAALPVTAQPAPPAAAMPAHAGPGMHHRGGAEQPGAPLLSPRLLEAIGASAEQKAQVRQLQDGAREDLRKLHDEQRTLQRQLADLLHAPKIDAAAAEALRQKQLAVHDAASKRQLQAMLDVGAVLTPEQRQKLAERRQRREQMMERHRRDGGERRPPEPPRG